MPARQEKPINFDQQVKLGELKVEQTNADANLVRSQTDAERGKKGLTRRQKMLLWAGIPVVVVGGAVGGTLGGLAIAQENGYPKSDNEITSTTLPGTPTTSEAGAGVGSPTSESTSTTVGNTTTTSAVEQSITTSVVEATSTTEVSASVPLIKIESAQQAVDMFGADADSKKIERWEINPFGGAHFTEAEKASRINTGGATWEGWLKFPMVDDSIDALTLVVHPNVPQVDLQGGTAWNFGSGVNEKAGFAQVLGQVRAKEPIEQPGVLVIPVCAELQPFTTESEPLNKIGSAEEAAVRFGADSYSSNPKNWEINEWGGAHLIDNPNGKASLVKTAGATLEGWDKINRDGITAITFVVHANVPQMRIHGGTFWDFPNEDRGFQQLLGQVERKEPIEQPGVLVIPVYDCTLAQK